MQVWTAVPAIRGAEITPTPHAASMPNPPTSKTRPGREKIHRARGYPDSRHDGVRAKGAICRRQRGNEFGQRQRGRGDFGKRQAAIDSTTHRRMVESNDKFARLEQTAVQGHHATLNQLDHGVV